MKKAFSLLLVMLLSVSCFVGCEKENGGDKSQNIQDQIEKIDLSDKNVGDLLIFGEYEQDNDLKNGKEGIEWLVIEKIDNKLLLLSKRALDNKQYNETDEDVTWETCSLRNWLNSDFYNEAFSKNEKELILLTHNINEDNEEGTDGGNDTEDKVFLLSSSETNKYLDSGRIVVYGPDEPIVRNHWFIPDEAKMCLSTQYAIAQGDEVFDDFTISGQGATSWWLRSPGKTQNRAGMLWDYGSIWEYGDDVDSFNTVRPAMWLSIE